MSRPQVLRRPLPAAPAIAGIGRTSGPPRQLESAAGREHRSAAASMDAVGRSAARCPAAATGRGAAAGGFLAALVLGSGAQVQLPEDIREAFRWPACPGPGGHGAAAVSLPCRSPAIGGAGGADGCDGLADS